MRVEQEYKALIEAGYRVIVVANMEGVNSDSYEIIRIDPNQGSSWHYNVTLTINPKLKKEVIDELSSLGVKEVAAFHVHDLLWSFLGVNLTKHYNAKLVIDLHENYPEFKRDVADPPKKHTLIEYCKMLLSSITNPLNGPIWEVIRERAYTPKRLIRYEKNMLKRCDRFIVVVDEALERFKKESFYKKGIVVSNTKNPDLWKFDALPKLEEKLIITYMGTVQDLRGLDTAILAMKYLDQTLFELNIVGVKLNSEMHIKFVTIIQENNISNVNLVEWQTDEQKAFSYINRSHVCIVPHKNTGLTQTTVPHKLFMYMCIGRPVLVSDVAPLKRIVETAKSGLIFKAEDEKDLSKKMESMRDRTLLLQFANQGRNAVESIYNWENDKNRMINMYAELFSS